MKAKVIKNAGIKTPRILQGHRRVINYREVEGGGALHSLLTALRIDRRS